MRLTDEWLEMADLTAAAQINYGSDENELAEATRTLVREYRSLVADAHELVQRYKAIESGTLLSDEAQVELALLCEVALRSLLLPPSRIRMMQLIEPVLQARGR